MNPQSISLLLGRISTARKCTLAALAGSVVIFAGCATAPESHLVTAPPPPAPVTAAGTPAPAPAPTTTTTTTYTTTTPPAPVAATIPGQPVIITTQVAPPAPPPESVPERPSSRHKWVPGYYTWNNQRYEWMAGHWQVPPTSDAVWVAPRWAAEGGVYRFYEGHWRT